MVASTQAVARDETWLFGRSLDLLLGAGVLYLLTVPPLLWMSDGASGWPILGVIAITLFVSAPHYGATLLRVYEQRADRRRYAFFAYYLTGFLALCFVVGVYNVPFGSLLVTVYISWSPWHVGGQNYGIALMFLRRRAVPVSPLAKRLLYASFFLSFVLALLSTHVADSSAVHAPGIIIEPGSYSVLRLGIPVALAAIVAPILLAAYVGASAGALFLFARAGSLGDVLPVTALILSQALWFVVPTFLYFADVNSATLLPFAALWISAAHSAQYLWVTTYYAKRSDPSTRAVPYLGRTLLAGLFITVIPALCFAPAFLGGVSWYPGLGPLLFAVVNLHHFALDGAVWKLRDGQVARALLRTAPSAESAPAAERRGNLWRVVWIGGALAFALTLYERVERRFLLPVIERPADIARAREALDRLSWIGRDSARDRIVLANAYLRQGDQQGALAQVRRSVEIFPSLAGWVALGRLHERAHDWDPALAAYRAALRIAPNDVPALVGLASMLRRFERREELARREEAAAAYRRESIGALERAVAIDPAHSEAQLRLAQACARDGHPADAIARLETALAAAPPDRRPRLAQELERLQAPQQVSRSEPKASEDDSDR